LQYYIKRKTQRRQRYIRTSTKSPKVLSSLGNNISSKLHDDTSGGLSTDGDVEVAFGVGPVWFEDRLGFDVRFVDSYYVFNVNAKVAQN
jgi:hypothetical protein